MTEMTLDDALLGSLRARARAATQGEWIAVPEKTDGLYGGGEDPGCGFDMYVIKDAQGRAIFDTLNRDTAVSEVHEDHDEHGKHAWCELSRRDAEFVAAANPTVVLTLVSQLQAARAESSRLAGVLGELASHAKLLVPEPDCSCHLSPPCNDCVEHSGIREVIEVAERISEN